MPRVRHFSDGGAGMSATLPPPTPMQQIELADARAKFAPINHAVVIGTVDAYALSIMAGLSLMLLVVTERALAVTAVLTIVAIIEFIQLRKLLRLSPSAPRFLGVNQLALSALMVGYAIFRFIVPAPVPPRLVSWMPDYHPDDAAMLYRWGMIVIYLVMIAIGVFMQGSLAVYYLTRHKHLQSLLTTTPQWILDAQRKQSTL
jgi:hypothetical protein